MKMTFGRLIENNQIVKLLSLLVAIGIWFGVVNGIDSHTTRIVRDVPVQITTLGTAVGRLGLSALLEEELLADVTISGSRNVIGNVTETDISIRPQLSGVVGPGVYELRLDAYDANGLGFEILSIRTPTVQVRFDRMTTKKLALKLDMTGITVPDAYMMGEEYVSPGEVTVTGPETELNLIQSGLVRVAIEEPLEKNTSLNAEVLLLDAENTQVQSPFVTLDSPSATITIPILKKKTLPVAIG
jgi:YbbR domain-containing protein